MVKVKIKIDFVSGNFVIFNVAGKIRFIELCTKLCGWVKVKIEIWCIDCNFIVIKCGINVYVINQNIGIEVTLSLAGSLYILKIPSIVFAFYNVSGDAMNINFINSS